VEYLKMKAFLSDTEYQDNPISVLKAFLEHEQSNKLAGYYDKMRFVGYVLDIGYDSVKIITSDPFKRAVGGIPRGSFLIMVPDSLEGIPPHFTLLRVQDVAPTPLTIQVQQTYFELHKKSMPELDVWTQSELQWGALNTAVLGMFYPSPEDSTKLSFSGDVNTVVSGHRYCIYAPTEELQDLIVNGIVREDGQFQIGNLRLTECQLPFSVLKQSTVPIKISTKDFQGFRTAMFGKTRLGKSNVVKLIAQSLLETTEQMKNVGQLIFDINGEYANDNAQNRSLKSAYSLRCEVYSLLQRPETKSHPLKLNFYSQPNSCLAILADLLQKSNHTSQYIKAFSSVQLPSIDEISILEISKQIRAVRKIQMFWAILEKAGFSNNEDYLKNLNLRAKGTNAPAYFNPAFKPELRKETWSRVRKVQTPPAINSLADLRRELEVIVDFMREVPDSSLLQTDSGKDLFDSDDKSLLNFLKPTTGGGPIILQPHRILHDPSATDVVKDIIMQLDSGKTVILDLGSATDYSSATDYIRRYFSDLLSQGIFSHQEEKFTSNNLGNHFIQLYFEEAHNLFPRNTSEHTDVYSRFAKEGAKFHIGMVYSTQSPSTISQELLAQTENFFVGHLSSQDETKALAKVQIQFAGLEEEIMRSRTTGYMRMLTFSHRFVIPMQAFLFGATSPKDVII
jgi:hypothetical protein